MAREDYSDLYEREYFDDYYVREDDASTGTGGADGASDTSDSGSAPGAEPAAPAATKASTNSKDAGSDPAKTPSASQPTSSAAAPSHTKPAENHFSPNITLTGHGVMSDLGNGLLKFLFGRSDDAEVLERSVEDEDLYARDSDEELYEREFDEDLYAREFDEDIYAREFDDELWAREFDEELWAREEEEVHPHHHQHIPPQANTPTKEDRKELGVFPHHNAEQREGVAHQHTHHHFGGAQQPMQGLTPKREFIDELRERMDYYDELD